MSDEQQSTGRPARRFVLVETGEVRAPKINEYYIDTLGRPQVAGVNFSSWSQYPILRLEEQQ